MKKFTFVFLCILAIPKNALCLFFPDVRTISRADFVCQVHQITFYALKDEFIGVEGSVLPINTHVTVDPLGYQVETSGRRWFVRMGAALVIDCQNFFKFKIPNAELTLHPRMTPLEIVGAIFNATGIAPIVEKSPKKEARNQENTVSLKSRKTPLDSSPLREPVAETATDLSYENN